MPSERQARRFRNIQRWRRVLPELAAYDDEQACIADWKHAVLRAAIGWRILLFALLIASALIAAFAADRVIVPYIPALRGWTGGLFGGLAGGLFPMLSIWVFRKDVRRRLHEKLLARGIQTCIQCGYDLRGQVEPRCPECGTPFDLDRQSAPKASEES